MKERAQGRLPEGGEREVRRGLDYRIVKTTTGSPEGGYLISRVC